MVILNDYLYSGDTVLRILHNYIKDLRKDAKKTGNEIDMIHCNFLLQIQELLEHNDFLTAQSQKMREFYKYMAKEYPFMAFTFKGRIKSLIRAEEKFNGYVVEFIYDYYEEHGKYPSIAELKKRLSCFRDLIAYRIIICSDGVTDYINKSYYNDDLWKVTESLEKIIKENKEKSLDVLNNKIITEANLNGGGDNITIITSKVLK